MKQWRFSMGDVYKTAHYPSSILGIAIDPLAFRITWFLANYTKISPNMITVFSAFLGLVSMFFFLKGTHIYLIYGVIFFQLSYVLDFVDGQLARVTKQETKVGEKLEFIRDKGVHAGNLGALVYGQYIIHNDNNIILVGIVYFLLLFLYWLCYRSFLARSFMKESLYATKKSYTVLTASEARTIAFLFGPLVFHVAEGLRIAIFLLCLLLMYRVYLFFAVYRNINKASSR